MKKQKLLIFIVTYNAEKTIENVLTRIPIELFERDKYETEILIIDDASHDDTVERSRFFQRNFRKVPLHIFKNKNNLGYGGNQKLGYRYALDHGFDIVALVHGDGQYAPEELPKLLEPFLKGELVVFGSRMLTPGSALAGGMPVYKYFGNKLLTAIENWISKTSLSEYHSGYRLYSRQALERIPFEENADGFDFDTDIILQLHLAGIAPKELAVPTFYGDEICYVNIISYSLKIIWSCILFRLHQLSLAYHPKFQVQSADLAYQAKFNFPSSHKAALAEVPEGGNLLILGSGSSLKLLMPFLEKASSITAVDLELDQEVKNTFSNSFETDLDELDFSQIPDQHYDCILLLDVIEHLYSAEEFLKKLRREEKFENTRIIISTANIAFISMRISLLLGRFNYVNRGILDRTHIRLLTFSSFKNLLLQAGFKIQKIKGIPAPFPLVFGDNFLSRALLGLNKLAIIFFRNLFSYQIFFVAEVKPTTESLLKRASKFARDCEREAH